MKIVYEWSRLLVAHEFQNIVVNKYTVYTGAWIEGDCILSIQFIVALMA
jgi:hypothetical protein